MRDVRRVAGVPFSMRSWFLLPLAWLALLLTHPPAASGQSLSDFQDQFRRGRYEEVIKVLQTRADVSSSLEAAVLLIRSLQETGRYAEAHTNAMAAASNFHRSLRSLLLARETSLYQDDLEGAARRLNDLKFVIEYALPRYPNAEELVALGEALLLLQVEPRLVLENCFRRAENMPSPPREAFLATGRLGLEKYDFALAANAFRAGLQQYPGDPDLQNGLAQAFQPSDRKEMLSAIEAALEVNPRHVSTLLLLADHLIDSEQYTEAETQLARALEINPHHPEAHAYRAVLAHLRNQPDLEQKHRAAALAHYKGNPRVDHLIGLKLSRKYRFKEGAEAQRRALALQPQYVPARRQLAEDLLRLGDIDEGWQLAESVHQRDAYDVMAYNLTTLRDQMAKFATLTNAHFIVRMAPLEAELYGDRVLALLDRAKAVLCDKYGVQLERPTVVEIFPDQRDFAVRTFGMPGNPGYLGVCFGSVITANSPASQTQNPSNWEDVLWHEFCHVVTLNATLNRMPRWLSEGISVFEEREANPTWGERMNLAFRDMILNGELTPLGKLSSAFLTPKSPRHLQFAYFESSLVVEFLVQRFGLESIRNILADLRNGKDINEAIAARTAPLAAIEKQFETFAREKAEQLAPKADLAKPERSRLGTPDLVWERLHPNNYYLRMQKARDLIEEKRWADAKPLLESLAETYSGERGADNPLWLLAAAHRNLNDTNAEWTALEKLAAQECDFPELFVRLIELSENRKDWIAVSNYAERLMSINPLISLPHRSLAKSNAALGHSGEAIVSYRKLLLLDPPDPAEVHFQVAKLLHARGDSPAEAKRHVLQALEEAPRFREAHRLLLQLSEHSGRNQPGSASVQEEDLP